MHGHSVKLVVPIDNDLNVNKRISLILKRRGRGGLIPHHRKGAGCLTTLWCSGTFLVEVEVVVEEVVEVTLTLGGTLRAPKLLLPAAGF